MTLFGHGSVGSSNNVPSNHVLLLEPEEMSVKIRERISASLCFGWDNDLLMLGAAASLLPHPLPQQRGGYAFPVEARYFYPGILWHCTPSLGVVDRADRTMCLPTSRYRGDREMLSLKAQPTGGGPLPPKH